jgi:hypothetical protein
MLWLHSWLDLTFPSPPLQSVGAVLLFVPSIKPAENAFYDGKTTLQKWISLDWIGAFISVGMIICLLLPLQWGGVIYAWSDRRIIALFCVFAVLFLCFIAWEFFKGERAMLPLFLFRRRTQVGAGIAMFFMMVAFLVRHSISNRCPILTFLPQA